jgi:tetratricopeptide (TPR) repeat protein
MDETDLFFNLRLGEIVIGTGHVPTENLLSFSHPAATDINLAWLFQIVLALVHRAAGIPGTVLLKTAFVLVTWGLLFGSAVRRGATPALAAAFLALAAWAAEPRFVERPHLVTFLGLALLLLALARAEAKQPRMLWWLLPCGLVWANANSCFFLAPTLLLLYALGASVDGLRAEAKRALLVALAFIPGMVGTPSGLRCFIYIANHFRMPYLRPLEEYRHARWPLDGPYFFLVAGLLAVGLLSRFGRQRSTALPVRVFLPCAALGFLGGFRIRFVAEFAMLAGPALALAATRLGGASLQSGQRWERWSRVAIGVLLIALTVGPRGMAKAEGGRPIDLGMEIDLVPVAAIDFVEKNGLRERMYNDLEVGSYLTWRGWPRYRVFQDPRINGYPDAFHAVLRRSDLSRGEWQRFLDGFAVTSALITYPSVNPRGALFDPRLWGLVYRANDGLVFVRRPVPDGLAEIPLSFSYSAQAGLLPVPLDPMPSEAALSVCEWQWRLGEYHRSAGDSAAALRAFDVALAAATDGACERKSRTAAGVIALELGQPGRAVALLAGDAGALAKVNHGYALLALGHAAPALSDFDSVLAVAVDNDEATFGRGLCLVALGQPGPALIAFQTLLARSPNHLSAPAARQQLQRLGASVGKR